MRILAISDLHTDFQKNRQIIEQLSDTAYQNDTLLVAGDIASKIEVIQETLTVLCEKFRHIFYVPGNHEFWVGNGHSTSIDKFLHILEICDTLGVHIRPARIGKVWIVPLFSWYASDFDDDGHEYTHQLAAWTDFYACRWPKGLDIAEYFYKLNQPYIQPYEGPVISFSHFLPRLDLLPPRQFLYFKALPQVAGSVLIEKQIRQLRSDIHVFGHSHIRWDSILNGIRYIHNPLSHPRRSSFEKFPEKIIWAS
jgi:predicted phosphodiesterase